MKWSEVLAGPFGRDYWLSYNRGGKQEVAERWGVKDLPDVYVRNLSVYGPSPEAARSLPPPFKYRLIKKDGDPLPACRFNYAVTTDEYIPKAPWWRLDGIYNIAFSDLLYDGNIYSGKEWKCTAEGLKPAVADIIRLDVDLPAPSELDNAVKQVLARLEKLGLDAAVLDSGARGFHVWFVPEVPVPAKFVPALRRGLAARLDLEVDPQTVGDPMRCFRMPWTINLKSGRRAKFIHGGPWPKPIALEEIKALILIGMEVKMADLRPPPKEPRRIPRWVRRLIEHMCQTRELCHYGRVAIARSLLAAGWSIDQVVEVFKCVEDFDEKKTRYHVEYEAKRLAAGEKPWRCETVIEHCGESMPQDLCENLNRKEIV
ncbi:MAG: hypothetical protein QXP98_08155 [Thermoproteus sp.]